LVEVLSGGRADRSLIYYGLRGVGKTVLLMELDILASEAGWATTDVQEVGSQPDFRATFAQMASRLLREMSRKHRIKERVDRALGVVKAFSVLTPGGGLGCAPIPPELAFMAATDGHPSGQVINVLPQVRSSSPSRRTGIRSAP
jgi:hypothetical protein